MLRVVRVQWDVVGVTNGAVGLWAVPGAVQGVGYVPGAALTLAPFSLVDVLD